VPVVPVLATAGLLVGARPGCGSMAEAHGRDRKPAVRRWWCGAWSRRTDGGRPRTTPPGEAS
jgi:hypothetical protein